MITNSSLCPPPVRRNFVFNVGDNGFIVGHRRLIDLFTSMRDYLVGCGCQPGPSEHRRIDDLRLCGFDRLCGAAVGFN